MKSTEIRGRSTVDLLEEISGLEREIANLRFRAGSEKATDPSRIGGLRRDLARIRTVLRERELDVRGQGADAAAGRTRKAAQ
jgi:large subunit ribosomal protein L29